ncbi:hypothetical protein P692DRAFT_20573946 [Suillus brevipes Sb2]|nr:hypothetical protein P692DRAFT_20573946 [Suillus brevipes Sb2]
MTRQPGQSRSEVQPVALLLTQTQRDELDEALRDTLVRHNPNFLSTIRNPETAHEDLDLTLGTFLSVAVLDINRLLKRNNLKNVFDVNKFSTMTVTQHPQLRKIISDACQSGFFSQVLDLKILRLPDTGSATRPKLAQAKDESEFLYDSFVRPYIGEAVDGFYDYLKKNHLKFMGNGRSRPYYAKFCSIVQSSGTGKSRLMTEVGIINCMHISGA